MKIVDFAKEIGCSTATVSRAFSTKGRISPATRDFIRAKAQELGYRPNLQARNMVLQRTNTLALFYSAPERLESDYYVSELICGITNAINAAGMYLQVHAVPAGVSELPTRFLDLIHSHGVDGFIVNMLQPWAPSLLELARQKQVPHIVLDNTREEAERILSLGAQIETASSRVGEYFRRLGRRHPGFIHGIHDERKLAGFRRGLGELAAELVPYPGGTTFNDGFNAFEGLRAAHPETDCLYCANDVLGIGAMRAALNHGVCIPQDLAVIGCDDLQMARFFAPSLTTIQLPKYELGELAVKRLLAQIEPSLPSVVSRLECELILRESA
jgi:DNA-binding LacI/PurR family transcriptional regulator